MVENPVTLVLYNHSPFVVPYLTLKEFIPAYGPQFTEILVGLILLDANILGIVLIGAETQTPPVPFDEDDELETELDELEAAHDCFVMVVLFSHLVMIKRLLKKQV